MSRLGSLYIERGEPDGELSGCCETAEWAAGEIERLDAENSMMRAERNKLRSALVGLIREDREKELREMNLAVHIMPVPEEDKDVTIAAIAALLEVRP